MTAIGFYHLTRTTAADALPPLLGRTLEAGERAVIRCGTAERLAALDRALWLCPKPDWLPHGTTHPELQPIYLTLADERPNGANYLFLLDGTATAALDAFTRVFDLFDGTDTDAVAAARQRWTAAKQAGHTLTYWQQGPTGWAKA
jgi:DNA polymerase-3 subunit chi